jgi:hypothetical protein
LGAAGSRLARNRQNILIASSGESINGLQTVLQGVLLRFVNNKKGFSRGRKPGSKLNKSKVKTKNPNDRPGLQRFSVSMPVELARFVRLLKPMFDREYSKLFRHGFDLVVEEGFKERKIEQKTYDEYLKARHLFKDEDFSGCVSTGSSTIDLDKEPTEEEILSSLVEMPRQ